MAAIGWIEVRGQKFSEDEAREASDFDEVLSHFQLEPALMFQLFHQEGISIPKRLVLAEKAIIDDVALMVLGETDVRIRAVIQARLGEARLNGTGGIIC